MKISIKLLLFVFCLLMLGCSQKELYQAAQHYQKSECMNKARSGTQMDECDKLEKKSFEEYEKERKEVTEK